MVHLARNYTLVTWNENIGRKNGREMPQIYHLTVDFRCEEK